MGGEGRSDRAAELTAAKAVAGVISAYVRCSDGPEGDWIFDVLPRLGEIVVLRRPFGSYRVVKIEHYPVPENEVPKNMERGVSLRLLLVDYVAEESHPWGDGF